MQLGYEESDGITNRLSVGGYVLGDKSYCIIRVHTNLEDCLKLVEEAADAIKEEIKKRDG